MSDYQMRAKMARARLADLQSVKNPMTALPQAIALADDLVGFLVELVETAETLAARLDHVTPYQDEGNAA